MKLLVLFLLLLWPLTVRADVIARPIDPLFMDILRSRTYLPPIFRTHGKLAAIESITRKELTKHRKVLLGDKFDPATVEGLYYQYLGPQIYLVAETPKHRLTHNFLHEYGHHLWFQVLTHAERMAYTMDWWFLRGHQLLSTDYSYASVEEGFADAFALYCLNKPISPYEREDIDQVRWRLMAPFLKGLFFGVV